MLEGLSAEVERKPMVIDETLYAELRGRYGSVAGELIIFYTHVKQYQDDRIVRALYPQRTYYNYRHILVRDGYLSLDEFRSIGGGTAYWP